MASLREIKTNDELILLKKAIQISAQGQKEVMKAIKPEMSEREVKEYISWFIKNMEQLMKDIPQ